MTCHRPARISRRLVGQSSNGSRTCLTRSRAATNTGVLAPARDAHAEDEEQRMNQARRRARRRGGQPSRKGHGTRTWLLGAGGLVVAFVLGWALVAAGRGSSSSSDVGCSAMEQLSYHVHAHLSIYV